MAPRAMKYDRVSSTLVPARSVSPRTLFATDNPMAERAAVSHRTIRSAEPERALLVGITSHRHPVHVQWQRHGGHLDRIWFRIERGHFDANGNRQSFCPPPTRTPS